ncbi:unnamed protein product [Acanthocheilonema viteae]|uniref:Uncharacterized protein n=1 Tax=Acanthocheilonema viteae TaxID=6277 RepID=A0A498SE00_ACAVI|nr:unnamed protein product [Acanthocheilonema viteae]
MQKIWLSGDKKLLLTNTVVTSSLLGISDTLQQWISGDYNSSDQNKSFNVTRTRLALLEGNSIAEAIAEYRRKFIRIFLVCHANLNC